MNSSDKNKHTTNNKNNVFTESFSFVGLLVVFTVVVTVVILGVIVVIVVVTVVIIVIVVVIVDVTVVVCWFVGCLLNNHWS